METKPPRFYSEEASPRGLQRRVLVVLAGQVKKLEESASNSEDPDPDDGIIQPALSILKVLHDLVTLQEKEELSDLKAAEKLTDKELDDKIDAASRNAPK